MNTLFLVALSLPLALLAEEVESYFPNADSITLAPKSEEVSSPAPKDIANPAPSNQCCETSYLQSHMPCLPCGYGFFVSGELLYWKTHDNFSYGTLQEGTGTTRVKNHRQKINFDRDLGFKVGIGAYFCKCNCNNFDIQLNWTRIKGRRGGSTTPGPDEIFFAFSNDPDLGVGQNLDFEFGEVFKANVGGHVTYNALDLELGREMNLSCGLSFRPFIGVRSSWIWRDYTIHFDGFEGNQTGMASANTKLNFYGVGPRGGLYSNWSCGGNFSLYGDLDIALLWVDMWERPEITFQENASSEITTLSDSVTLREILIQIDYSLGIKWQSLCCSDSYKFALNLGWENHHYQDIVSFSGLVLGARLDF